MRLDTYEPVDADGTYTTESVLAVAVVDILRVLDHSPADPVPATPAGFDVALADLARQSVAEARRTAAPEQSLILVALKVMHEKVLKQGGSGSLLHLKPYVDWALGGQAPPTPGEVEGADHG